MPVSSLIQGTYGIRDVCLSVPTVVGREGIETQLEIELWPKEVSALQHSGQVLRETIDQVLRQNPSASKTAAPKAEPMASKIPSPSSNGRAVQVTMGSGANGGRGSARVTISGQRGGGRHG